MLRKGSRKTRLERKEEKRKGQKREDWLELNQDIGRLKDSRKECKNGRGEDLLVQKIHFSAETSRERRVSYVILETVQVA